MRYLSKLIGMGLKRVLPLFIVGLSGCATVSTWEATGRASIKIDAAEQRSLKSGVDMVVVLGKKTFPVIPDLINSSNTGEVALIPLNGKEETIIVHVSDVSSNDEGRVGIDIVEKGSFQASIASEKKEPRPLSLHGRAGFLFSDLDCYRNYLVVPVRRESWRGEGELWTVCVLENPRIPYGKDEYSVRECNTGVVVRRLVFMPFAIGVDIVTLPFQVILGLFAHM